MRKIKKLIVLIIILALVGAGGYYLYNKKAEEIRINNIKKGWYVEITSDFINVRKSADTSSKTLGKVEKGEVYEVIEMNLDNSLYYWYHIKFDKKTDGWIANPRKKNYLNDVNNPTDIKAPSVKYFDEDYHVFSFDKIKYDHLEITDDRDDYTITSKVYHEVDQEKAIDQYWIEYIVTDASGKSDSKIQRIIFDVAPNESDVLPFSEMRK